MVSYMNFFGCVGHVTLCLIECSLVRAVSSLLGVIRYGIRVRIRFSAWFVSGYAHVGATTECRIQIG